MIIATHPVWSVHIRIWRLYGDGIISRAEWRGSERAFQNQDWNGDGQLSGPEVRLGGRRSANFEEADHVPNRFERFVSWTHAGFNNLDWNNNGRVERAEWYGSDAVFASLDRNHDGELRRFEVAGGVDTPNDTWDQFASLSRQEFAVAGGAPGAVRTSGGQRTVRVDARERWARLGHRGSSWRHSHDRRERCHSDERR